MMINVHSKYHSIKLITFGAVRLLGESSKHVNVVINWMDLPAFVKCFYLPLKGLYWLVN